MKGDVSSNNSAYFTIELQAPCTIMLGLIALPNSCVYTAAYIPVASVSPISDVKKSGV